MIASPSPFQPVSEPDVAGSARTPDVWDFAEDCIIRTAAALQECRAATPAEISQAVGVAREQQAGGKPSDMLEALSRIQGHGEERIGHAILELGNRVASTLSPYAPLIPFAGKLIAPSAFYESFDQIHRIARALLSPVIYSEDTDSIGTASINPVSSVILADEIRNTVYKRFGIRPFLTIVRLDYESWSFLCRKHFEL